MSDHTNTCVLDVHVAWWLMPYLRALAFICAMTGMEPNMDKVKRLIDRGVTVKAKPVRANQLTRNEHGNQ